MSVQDPTGGKSVVIVEEVLPDEWEDGLCPECDSFTRWTIQSDLGKPRNGKVECTFCNSEEFFEITQ